MHSVRIEQAQSADVAALVNLLGELFAIEQDFQADNEKQMRGLHMLMTEADAVVLVARGADNKVVGMVTAQMVISTAEGAYSTWVEDMVVTAGWRGKGVGRALLEHAVVWAKSKGASRAQLLVDLDNQPAIDYYHHLAWQQTRLGARRLKLS